MYYSYSTVIVQPWELKHCVAYINNIDFGIIWCHFRKHFQTKALSVAHSLYYIVYI